MSNNMNTPSTIRWQLLSTVSAFALLASACAAGEAMAADADADHPVIWLELGGQAENISGQGEVFAPAFLAANPTSSVLGTVTPLQAQRPTKFSFGEEGRISFQPESSDWVFSAAIRYGRSSNSRDVHHQTYGSYHRIYKYGVPGKGSTGYREDFADTLATRSERHLILDFVAGKDVGLGMLGSSVLSAGVRFAQFTSSATVDMRARPDLHFKYATFPSFTFKIPHFHTYHVTGHASRGFHGVGPSVSWTGSVPFAGNRQDGEMMFDWGGNAAILFGKQRARVQHHNAGHYYSAEGYNALYSSPGGHDVERSITVPNVGGSIGLSWCVQDFKVSMGYRADFFFGAIDGGIDAAKKSNATFNGPYASISIGLGD